MEKAKYLELRTKALYEKNLTWGRCVEIFEGDVVAAEAAFVRTHKYRAERREKANDARSRKSEERRKLVLSYAEEGFSAERIAEMCDLSVRHVNRLKKLDPVSPQFLKWKHQKMKNYFYFYYSQRNVVGMEEEAKKNLFKAVSIKKWLIKVGYLPKRQSRDRTVTGQLAASTPNMVSLEMSSTETNDIPNVDPVIWGDFPDSEADLDAIFLQISKNKLNYKDILTE